MARPSVRERRRTEIATAFVRVLATHGQSGATIAAVATEANIAPGLVHHFFADRQDLVCAAIDLLITQFRQRTRRDSTAVDPLQAYGDAALKLDANADLVAARAWVGLFAEALSDPALFQKMRRILDGELAAIQRQSGGVLTPESASAVLSFIVGSLVFGAFAPRRAAGFAAPNLRRLLTAL